MCRWLAYSGAPIALSSLLTRPTHSLIDQSAHAQQNDLTTNGDGFGVGWYGEDRSPGTFHDTHPAWNNLNLRHLAKHVRSPLFLAHVRASTGTPVQDTNCHPFAYGDWLFQHNGSVPEYTGLRRELLFEVDSLLFRHVRGSTDSEILFFLALTFGLESEPRSAMERLVGHVEAVKKNAGVQQPLTFSAVATDGRKLFATRYASDGSAPTLYHSRHPHALRAVHGTYETLPDGAIVLLSEPLDDLREHWQEIPEASFVTVASNQVTIEPFAPRSHSSYASR